MKKGKRDVYAIPKIGSGGTHINSPQTNPLTAGSHRGRKRMGRSKR